MSGGGFRSWAPKVLGAAVIVLVGIQFVPYSVDNPSARDEPKWDSPRTRELFMRSCADCHSNESKVLWFEHVAPVKWFVANHVEEGRSALNVSEWHSAAGRDMDELTEVVKKGEMPLPSYTWFGLHSDAVLTAKEKQELMDGLQKTLQADPPTLNRKGGEGGDGDGDGD